MLEKPSFVQGVFSATGQGLGAPTSLTPRARYSVPADKRAQTIYFRAGNAAPELIALVLTRGGEPMRFRVVVRDGGSSTEHEVTVPAADLERLGSGRSPEAFVLACFEFLLEREPRESILRAFDVGVIGRYFPEFEREISRWR